MDTAKLIEEAERLSAKATPGPWRQGSVHAAEEVWAAYPEGIAGLASERLLLRLNPNFTREQDTTFIARARTLVPDLAAALRESEERARKAEHDRDAARAELAQPAICPNCTAKMRRLDRMDSAGHAAYELDKARKDAAGQNKRAQKAEQEAKALRAELARFTTPRPIAEAPRDGTWIGAIWGDMTPEQRVQFGPIVVVQWSGTRWEDTDGNGYEPPTHYIPLPEVKP